MKLQKEKRTRNYHGMYHTRFYRVWCNILQRCEDENSGEYKRYGGRGIKCLWNSFEEFKNDMFSTYKDGLSIDRINNNGNYSKENCKWSTPQEQANNRRTNHYLEYNGKKLSIADWARELGFTYDTIKLRIKKGWSIEDTFLTAPK
jgi:hypothetical protein